MRFAVWLIVVEGIHMSIFISRFIGAILLRREAYEDVEADRSALGQALVVVLASAVAAGIGSFGVAAGRPIVIAVIIALALGIWVFWGFVAYQIGARLMPSSATRADLGELLRTIGFAAAPGVFRIFGFVPGMTTVVFAITELWMLVAMIVAIRQALDYTSTARAAVVCGLGWVIAIVLFAVFGTLYVPALS